MIKNIIFDVGMVLVDFSWEKTFRDLGLSGSLFEAAADATVRSPLWNEYDRSRRKDDEILAGFIANAPQLEDKIRMIWDHIGDMIRCYPYTREWIREWKKKGYGCYVLSNYPERSFHLTKKELQFTEDMDGAVFSYQVKAVKPEPEIYQALMDQYGLCPGECVFLDDNENNVKAAVEFGLKAVLFQNKEQADRELSRILNESNQF